MKICPNCLVKKDSSGFGKCASKKDGLQSNCKDCRKDYSKKNKEALKKKASKYYRENAAIIKERSSKCRKENKERIREYKQEYREKNREQLNDKQKEYARNNKEARDEYGKAYYQKNADKIKDYQKEYAKANRAKILTRAKRYHNSVKDRRNAYERERKRKDPQYKFLSNARSRISEAIKVNNGRKVSSTKELLGCSIPHLKAHLEKQFTKGMTWENYGEWHVDHIIPCASFDLTKPDQQRQCFHFTNLQPLWAHDNLKKRDRILSPIQMQFPI